MKIYRNILSQDTLSSVLHELNFLLQKNVWRSGEFLWQKELLSSSSVGCLATNVSNLNKEKIKHDLRNIVPDNGKDFTCQFFIWQRGSAISRHDDSNRDYGITIYLNENWDIDDGGIFMWKESNEDFYRAHFPERNSAAVNTSGETHFITPVTQMAKENRFTIQIWS